MYIYWLISRIARPLNCMVTIGVPMVGLTSAWCPEVQVHAGHLWVRAAGVARIDAVLEEVEVFDARRERCDVHARAGRVATVASR